jgi:hypothetical protein
MACLREMKGVPERRKQQEREEGARELSYELKKSSRMAPSTAAQKGVQ